MNKLTTAAVLSLAALGLAAPRASAWCCKGCCSTCLTVNYAQPNAFSPFCPAVSGCCGLFGFHKCCAPACCVPCPPCVPGCGPCCGPACGPMMGNCADGCCGGPAISSPATVPSSVPAKMPPASNGDTNHTAPMPMPMPSAQAYPYPPMMGGYPMVQPVGYPPSYGQMPIQMPTMMGAPYGAGYGGTTYGPAPAYWNANYRGY